jgi:hypothetical protein
MFDKGPRKSEKVPPAPAPVSKIEAEERVDAGGGREAAVGAKNVEE